MHKRYVLNITLIAIFVCIIFLAACKTTTQTLVPPMTNSTVHTTPAASTDISTLTTTVPISPSLKIFIQAPLTIDKTFDGREVNVNLVKFTGSVSSSNSTVMVNSITATVNNDGSYYAYLDLKRGKNTIEIKTTTDQITTSDTITVNFIQPLIVNLNWPDTQNDVDYRKVPVTITGIVSDPLAKVAVNELPVTPGNDGKFSSQIQLKEGANYVVAVAMRGGDVDNSSLRLDVSNSGGVAREPPAFGAEFASRFIFETPRIQLKSGQKTTVGFGFHADRDISVTGAPDAVTIVRVSDPHSRDPLAALPALKINIDPSRFTLYPQIEYQYLINIQTGSDIVPGDYYYYVHTYSGRFGSEFWLTLNVTK